MSTNSPFALAYLLAVALAPLVQAGDAGTLRKATRPKSGSIPAGSIGR